MYVLLVIGRCWTGGCVPALPAPPRGQATFVAAGCNDYCKHIAAASRTLAPPATRPSPSDPQRP
jgi:hypothetical protein